MEDLNSKTNFKTAKFNSDQLASRLRWIPQAASASAVLIGGLVLVGWGFDVDILKTPAPGFPTVKANTATVLAFVLIGISLWLSGAESPEGWRRRVAQICASIAILIGMLALSEYLYEYQTGQDLEIDQLLLQERGVPVPHLNPGRMAFVSALNFLLLGGALLLLDVKTRRGYQPAPHLAVAITVSALLTLVAYFYGGAAIHQTYPFATVAPQTALLFIALSSGVLFARSQHTVVAIMTSDTVAAASMRRLLAVAVVLPIAAGWVRLIGQQRYDLYGTEFGLALIVLFGIVGLTASIFWQARSLIQAEVYQCTIHEMSALLSRSLQLEEVYPAFAAAVNTILLYERLGIIIPEGESLVMVHSVAQPPLAAWRAAVFPAQGTSIAWVMTQQTPRIVKDLAIEQVFTDDALIAREGVRSTIALPLLVGGKAIGSLVLDSRIPGVYEEGHVKLLSPVTEPLALALQNSRLYAQIVRYANELEHLVEARTRELRVANGHLAEASRHKSAFLANMSHELRTPLNAILGFSELLRDQTGGSLTAKQARYMDHIHTSGWHLLVLINDLLDLSKVEAGKLTLHPEPFVLSEALTAALRDIQPLADTKRLTLALDADTAPATLTADPVRFKQIIFNLLSNAVKFTPDGGRITVTARIVPGAGHREAGSRRQVPGSQDGEPQAPGDFVEIVVTDTGIGIAAEDLPKLFERFSQLETVKQSQGSGLGLALTKQLVELHGGMMTAASAGPGQGSSFTICLPLAPDVSRDMGEGC